MKLQETQLALLENQLSQIEKDKNTHEQLVKDADEQLKEHSNELDNLIEGL